MFLASVSLLGSFLKKIFFLFLTTHLTFSELNWNRMLFLKSPLNVSPTYFKIQLKELVIVEGSTSFSSVTSRSKSTRIPGGQTKSNLRGRKCRDYQPRGDTEWKVTNFDQRREEEGQGGEREREGPSEEHKTLRKFVINL